MKPQLLHDLAIVPALSLLPDRMNSPMARYMLIAIAVQESKITARKQVRGPARGYWQFEAGGGVHAVLQHQATKTHVRQVCEILDVPAKTSDIYEAVMYHDVLAAAMARLLLWWIPRPLPTTEQEGWSQYLQAWNPGKRRPRDWPSSWAVASTVVSF